MDLIDIKDTFQVSSSFRNIEFNLSKALKFKPQATINQMALDFVCSVI